MGSDPNNSGSNDDEAPDPENADHSPLEIEADASEVDNGEATVNYDQTVNLDKTTRNDATTADETPTVGPQDITANLSATSAEALLHDVTIPESEPTSSNASDLEGSDSLKQVSDATVDQTVDSNATSINKTSSQDAEFDAEFDADRTAPSLNQVPPERDQTEQNDATLPSISSANRSGTRFDQTAIDPQRNRDKASGQNKDTIGRYQIKRLLGEGTFGKVFEARDPQLDRIVAIKVAKAISGRTQIKRFLREARAAAKLRHPNIIPVYEYGQIDGENVIVYEFVQGATLKSYISDSESRSLEKTLNIIREIASGLDYAHQQGIIHRDIKPDNILLDPEGHPHIADFGCARSIEDDTNLTIDGSILGTPMYMSPEQASGKANEADGRTDIWSLGIMLFEMVSGEKPFKGQLSDLLFAIRNNDAPPLRKIDREISVDIETICQKCLTRDLAQRFQTAQTVADELTRYLNGQPIESRRIGPLARGWMWAKRNQTIASLATATVATLLIGTVVSASFAISAYREKQARAETQLQSITTAQATQLPQIFEDLVPLKNSIVDNLSNRLDQYNENTTPKMRLTMAMLALEDDPVRKNKLAVELIEFLLNADAEDFYVCRNLLLPYKASITPTLWKELKNPNGENSRNRRLRACAALASYSPGASEWEDLAADITGILTSVDAIETSRWIDAFEPIKGALQMPLHKAFYRRDNNYQDQSRRAAAIIGSLYSDDVDTLVDLVASAAPEQIPFLKAALAGNNPAAIQKIELAIDDYQPNEKSDTNAATAKANLATVAIQLKSKNQWKLLADRSDPSEAHALIQRLSRSSTSSEYLLPIISNWQSQSADELAGVLMALNLYQPNQIFDAEKEKLTTPLSEIFLKHPDARVHSCARLLLLNWDYQEELNEWETGLRSQDPKPNMNWHVDLMGNTFAIFDSISSFQMGLNRNATYEPPFDKDLVSDEPFHQKAIPRRFGICIFEVTHHQFLEFEEHLLEFYKNKLTQLEATIANQKTEDSASPQNPEADEKLMQLERSKKQYSARLREINRQKKKRANADPHSPVTDIDWFKSLAYCRWLNEENNLDQTSLPDIDGLAAMNADFPKIELFSNQDVLDSYGYRLPTASEWEFACGGKIETLYPFGKHTSFANQYAWYFNNASTRSHPVGKLLPGPTGLFDMLGNVHEWCLDWYRQKLPNLPEDQKSSIYIDHGVDHRSLTCEFRGGAYDSPISEIRISKRGHTNPIFAQATLGMRLARTYPSLPETAKKLSESNQ